MERLVRDRKTGLAVFPHSVFDGMASDARDATGLSARARVLYEVLSIAHEYLRYEAMHAPLPLSAAKELLFRGRAAAALRKAGAKKSTSYRHVSFGISVARALADRGVLAIAQHPEGRDEVLRAAIRSLEAQGIVDVMGVVANCRQQ